MKQVTHIQNNRAHLMARATLLRLLRQWFWQQKFVEIEAPIFVPFAGQEPNLALMNLNVHDDRKQTYSGFLHTSPEYSMKKVLAAGFENIFYLGKCFRDHESFGGDHNPEFTMLEWYRAENDMYAIMDDCENLIMYLINAFTKPLAIEKNYWMSWKRVHMRRLWRTYVDIDLDQYQTKVAMIGLCREKGYDITADETYESAFYRIFLDKIEPHLGMEQPTIVHHYPESMAALAKIDKDEPLYAERFELYIKGKEVANAFSELSDAEEQLVRLQQEYAERKAAGMTLSPIDHEFVDAVKHMPPAAGIALGVDRLVQLLLGCKDINDVLVLPMKTLFDT